MSQVNLYQYAEITLATGQVIRIGSKQIPSTISLTGNGVMHAQRWLSTSTATQVLDSTTDISGALFIAVKCSVDAVVSWAGTTTSGANADTSSIAIEAGVWQFFSAGTTTLHNGSSAETRSGNSSQTITQMWVDPASSGDIDIIAFK